VKHKRKLPLKRKKPANGNVLKMTVITFNKTMKDWASKYDYKIFINNAYRH